MWKIAILAEFEKLEHNYTENYDTQENIIPKHSINLGKKKNITSDNSENSQEKDEDPQDLTIVYIVGSIIGLVIILVLGILIILKIRKNIEQQQMNELEMVNRGSWIETLSVLQKWKQEHLNNRWLLCVLKI